jgi:calcium-dependent protein kinase
VGRWIILVNKFIFIVEFIAAFIGCSRFQNERFIQDQFKKIDQDGSGKINKQELMEMFHTDTIPINSIDIEELIRQADLNKDGEVTS